MRALYDHFHAPPADTAAGTPRAPITARLHLTLARHLARMMSRQPVEERALRHGLSPARPFAALEKVPRAVRHLIPSGIARWGEEKIGQVLVRVLRLFATALARQEHVTTIVRRGLDPRQLRVRLHRGIISSDDLPRRGLDAINNQDFRPGSQSTRFPTAI